MSEAIRALLAGPQYHIHVRVGVQRAGTTMGAVPDVVDLTHRLVEGQLSATMDDGARRFSVTFWAGRNGDPDGDTLQPLVGASAYNDPSPLLWAGNALELKVAIVAAGTTPTDEDFRRWEVGRIDGVKAADAQGRITVYGRDFLTAVLLDTKVRAPRKYGDPPETATDNVRGWLSAVVDDWTTIDTPGPLFGTQAWVPMVWSSEPLWLPGGEPPFGLNEYAQDAGPAVYEVCRTIALQAGWDYRTFPRHLGPTDEWGDPLLVPVLYDPDRTRTTPDAVIGLNEYTTIRELTVDASDVRNWIRARTGKTSTRVPIERLDAASITQYGPQVMELAESQMPGIDSEVEVGNMLDYALADLKDPYASHEVESLLWPYVELNDLHTYPAHPRYYDADLTMAVVGYTHTFSRSGGRTTMQVRGKPLAAYRRWRVGAQPPVLVSTNDPPPGAVAKEGTLWCKVDDLSWPA
ncbi:MAG TPA: hypothetical protein VFS08_09960 [Gemmatimonadaceae bacterium]|nr:hypothetical protein [Gemmatimonadaceae bacterium]